MWIISQSSGLWNGCLTKWFKISLPKSYKYKGHCGVVGLVLAAQNLILVGSSILLLLQKLKGADSASQMPASGGEGAVWTELLGCSLPGLGQTPRNNPVKPCWPVSSQVPPVPPFSKQVLWIHTVPKSLPKSSLLFNTARCNSVPWVQELWIVCGRKVEYSKKNWTFIWGVFVFFLTSWYSHFLNLGSLRPSRTPWSNCFKEWMRMIHKKYIHNT